MHSLPSMCFWFSLSLFSLSVSGRYLSKFTFFVCQLLFYFPATPESSLATNAINHSAHPNTSLIENMLHLTPDMVTKMPNRSTTSSTTAAIMKRGQNTRKSIK